LQSKCPFKSCMVEASMLDAMLSESSDHASISHN
jgi:hypothetical protein